MVKSKNQKLSNEQINTIFHLRQLGYNKSVIAKSVKQHCGVSLAVTYYHLDKEDKIFRDQLRERIVFYINEGMTTGQLAKMWNMPLALINNIYAR